MISSEAYKALYEHSPDGVLFTVPDGRVLAANPAACQILRRTEGEICSLGRQGLADPADERWSALLEERARAGGARGVARMLRGDGTSVEVELSTRIFRDSDGSARTCTIIRDVTARVTMEHELRQSRRRLAEAEHVAQIGSWEWDIPNDRVSWSDGLFEIFGVDPEQVDRTWEGGLEQRVFPEDRGRVRDALQQALEDRSSFTLEYRALRADGRVRTLRSHGEVVVDGAGDPIRVVGVAHDITDAKRAQEPLDSTSSQPGRHASELRKLALGTSAAPQIRREAPLTPRQWEILRLVAQGLTSDEIAARLYLAKPTVKWHIRQILAKTGAANRAEAVARVLGRAG